MVRDITGHRVCSLGKPIRQIGLDSLNFVELVLRIEEYFSIIFEEREIEIFFSLKDFIHYIKFKIQNEN